MVYIVLVPIGMQAYPPSSVLPQQDIIVPAWLKCFNELSSTCDKHLYPGLGSGAIPNCAEFKSKKIRFNSGMAKPQNPQMSFLLRIRE